MGKGYALKIGVQKSSLDWILTTDIDLSVPLVQILEWEKVTILNLMRLFLVQEIIKNQR